MKASKRFGGNRPVAVVRPWRTPVGGASRRNGPFCATTRRGVLQSVTTTLLQICLRVVFPTSALAQLATERTNIQDSETVVRDVDYDGPGPFPTSRLPRLEHTCTKCYPLCVGDRCLIRLQVFYPKRQLGAPDRPAPLAIISGGFLVKGIEYASYAERLASWGYVAVVYDKVENLMESLDDVVSMNVIREIMDWAHADPLMQQISDSDAVYLIGPGHSRGGKLSVLAAAEDLRVRSLCLIDPVDNTIYAPLGAGSVQSSWTVEEEVMTPLLAIGSELGTDCAPIEANYRKFYDAAAGVAVEVVVRDAGHFQFLDSPTTLDRAICLEGNSATPSPLTCQAIGKRDDAEVRALTQSLMVAWGEATLKSLLNTRPDIQDGYRRS